MAKQVSLQIREQEFPDEVENVQAKAKKWIGWYKSLQRTDTPQVHKLIIWQPHFLTKMQDKN